MSSAPDTEMLVMAPTLTSPEEEEAPTSVLTQPEEDTTKELDTSLDSQVSSEDTGSENLEDMETGNRESKVYENAKLMLMQTDEANAFQSIKVSGTLKLLPAKEKKNESPMGGCFPSCLVSVWGYLFD